MPKQRVAEPSAPPPYPIVALAGGGQHPNLLPAGLFLGEGAFLAYQLPDGTLRLTDDPLFAQPAAADPVPPPEPPAPLDPLPAPAATEAVAPVPPASEDIA